MGYSVFVAKGKDIYDVTPYSGKISWSDNIDTLGMQLDFSAAKSYDRFFPKFSIDPGDIAILNNGTKEIFRGIITNKTFDILENGFTAYDFCFYLNKSKIIKQFNGVGAAAAIQQVCAELDIKVGSIAPMNTMITHIYYDNTAAEIIDDILKQVQQETGKIYLKEMQGDSFYIFERTSKPVTAKFKPAVNLADYDVTAAISEPSRSLSIEEMKNSVLIVSGGEKSVRVLADVKDAAGIEKYGLLQEIESVDDKDANQVQNIAQNKLKELNRINETVSITLPGSDDVRAGRVLSVTEEIVGLKGNYLVLSSSHSIENGIHTMSLELEVI